jgi:hypothetical protein
VFASLCADAVAKMSGAGLRAIGAVNLRRHCSSLRLPLRPLASLLRRFRAGVPAQAADEARAAQPLTPWAQPVCQAMLEQQAESFAKPFTFRVRRCTPYQHVHRRGQQPALSHGSAHPIVPFPDAPVTQRAALQVRGVSFSNETSGDSRQALLKHVAPFDPILFAKEPDNPFDPNAVAVLCTRGQVGFVPGDMTAHFEHECSPGYFEWAASAGGVGDALIGASVIAMPGLRAAYTQALPRELMPWADLSSHLPASLWAQVESLQLEATFGRCQVTGLQGTLLNPEDVSSAIVARLALTRAAWTGVSSLLSSSRAQLMCLQRHCVSAGRYVCWDEYVDF